ncbi:restriction endonuclease [Mycolicibacterium llatzerense]|uniref:restriction endonuclease n=1 Tax=Mycolicibacterium llatzerense TaxID=280871 RepID=UPI0021B66268|nr:restriction endonuclease [Mycolicibacterium llatzerense]
MKGLGPQTLRQKIVRVVLAVAGLLAGVVLGVAMYAAVLDRTGDSIMAFGAGAAPCVVVLLLARMNEWRTEHLIRRYQERERAQAVWAEIDQMTGVQFEDYVAERLRARGWMVWTTAITGDYGVDLIAEKDGGRVAVQCKRLGKPVGVAAVQQVVSGQRLHKCASTMVVSNREFTAQAKRLARTHNCALVGRSGLMRDL